MSSTGVSSARARDLANDAEFVRTRETDQTSDDVSRERRGLSLVPTTSETKPAGEGLLGYRLRESEVSPEEAQSQVELPLDQREKRVEGVVFTVDQTSVSVRCRLPDRFVELLLPRSVVPDEVAHYGAAVSLEVDKTSAYRRLKISSRDVVTPIRDGNLAAIDAWLEKLGDRPSGK